MCSSDLNSGTITGDGAGLVFGNVSAFGGGITNSGKITSTRPDGFGILVYSVSSFTGNVSNSGTISAHGTGLGVFNVTAFGGGITNTGTISAGTGILVSSSGAVSVFDSGTIIGSGGTAVDLSGNAPGSTFTLGAGYNITGLVLGQNGDSFQLGGTGAGTFNLSLISDVIASGCSSHCVQYEGFNFFNVVSGVWTTTGTFSGTETWNVNGGTLAGTGTFDGIQVNSGGKLEPGTPGVAGTFMTLNGNLAFQSGAIYLVNLGAATASRANVAGVASLGGSVNAAIAGGVSNRTYDILHEIGRAHV